MQSEDALIAAARSGDRAAFDRLVEPVHRSLRSFAHRMVAQPDDAEDIVQETLIRAHRGLPSFRGDASLRTWLFQIATHVSLDHLRARRRWRNDAQLSAERFAKSKGQEETELAPIHGSMAEPGFVYDFHEHIAFCFACVSRSLPPEQQAALLLREVFGFTNDEAARMTGVTESVLRHHLSAARRSMEDAFDGLCALVTKTGACYQCDVLREACPEDRRGPPVQPIGGEGDSREERLRLRLRIVQEADLVEGTSRTLHRTLLRLLSRVGEGQVP